MFDFAGSELILIVVVALVVIGPKDLPRLLYRVGQWVGKAKRTIGQFQTQIEEMGRQSELEDLRQELDKANRKLAESGQSLNQIAAMPPRQPPQSEPQSQPPQPSTAAQAKPTKVAATGSKKINKEINSAVKTSSQKTMVKDSNSDSKSVSVTKIQKKSKAGES